MYYAPTKTWALARTSNLNEELGQIKYIFSDKTGTLTRNVMEFKKCTIAGVMYAITDPDERGKVDERESALSLNLRDHASKNIVESVMVLMAVCHTVIPETKEDGSIFFNASSPDEKALVEGALRYGFEFVARKPESVVIRTPSGEWREYLVLNVIEFTSTRKRMSVVVRTPEGQIRLFTKGADTMIVERLGKDKPHEAYYGATVEHLERFAKDGLRTLCLGARDIPESEYK